MSLRNLFGTIILATMLTLGFSGLAIAADEGTEAPTSEESAPPAAAAPDDAKDDAADDASDESAEDAEESTK